MRRPHPIRALREVRDALDTMIPEHTDAYIALHETGWLGASGKGMADDIRELARAWGDAERRAGKAEYDLDQACERAELWRRKYADLFEVQG